MMFDPNKFNPDDSRLGPVFGLLIIAHDVGRSRDRSTAVVGGNCPLGPRLLGIVESEELPQGLFGSARASALAVIDRRHQSNGLIVADLSTDASYAEVLHATFGRRVIGLQISRNGDGMNAELRAVNNSAMPVYTIGRSFFSNYYTVNCNPTWCDLSMDQTADALLRNLRHSRPSCVRAEQSINACQGSTMISPSLGPCWHGRLGIRI